MNDINPNSNLRISRDEDELSTLIVRWVLDCLPTKGAAIQLLPVAKEGNVTYKARTQAQLITAGHCPVDNREFCRLVEFLRLEPLTNTWIPIGDDKLYASRRLPEGLRYRLWLDGREIVMKPELPERGGDEEDDEEQTEEEKEEAALPQALRAIDRSQTQRVEENPPQIVVLSNGELMPFELHIERERQPALWRIVATAENDLRIEQRPDTTVDWEVIAQTNPPLDEREVNSGARK